MRVIFLAGTPLPNYSCSPKKHSLNFHPLEPALSLCDNRYLERRGRVDFQTLCVLGLGYIGLPTASTFATHGLRVIGVDVDRHVVDVLRNGEVHIHEPGLRTLVQAAIHSGNLVVSEVPEAADAFVIAVPTPLSEGADKQADLSYVIAASESIVPYIQPGNLVVLESTSPPRTTLDVVAPILERSGLQAGSDFHLAYTPERVLPGQILRELIENARVIGGIDRASAEAGRDLYAIFVRGEILLTDATTAEMVKLMENTYRDINIAVANEFARVADRLGVDIWEAIELANRHPRIDILRPGPGVGGHCISIDPWFLVQTAPDLTPITQQARQTNDDQPAYVVNLVNQTLDGLSGRRIAALGLAYKSDVDDLRESPAIEVARLLASEGAKVRTYEPFDPGAVVPGAEPAASLEMALQDVEAVILLVDHQTFRELDPQQVKGMMSGHVAIDTHGVWDRAAWDSAGFELHVLGVGGENA
ncbi:MAG: nucleotide sugar dehydrogenase [Anaerolineaceae bacterium]|nr:MAG: nucleotide sugar dehydrogenase [Anaerolineaceae bacterium]